MRETWEIVEHNWSETSIYNQDGRLICTKIIEFEAIEENQDELGEEVLKDFNLIICGVKALELLKNALSHIEDLKSGDYAPFPLRSFEDDVKDLLNRAKK